MAIESTPITGAEQDPGDDSPLAALSLFYRGFNGRDLDTVATSWARTEEIVMDNPLGGIMRGWAQIRGVYQRLFGGAARVSVEFYDYSLIVTETMFCTIGRERGQLVAGDRRLELAIRTTRVFQRLGGNWRQVHHHGSMDDAGRLAEYQRAVLGSATAS